MSFSLDVREKYPIDNYRETATRYNPCSPLSKRHQLICDHLVETPEPEQCAPNCLRPFGNTGTPFICRACTIRDVEIGLRISDEDDAHLTDTTLSTNMINALVDEEMENKKRNMGYRCREGGVNGKNGLVQYLRNWPRTKHEAQAMRCGPVTLNQVEIVFNRLEVREGLDVEDVGNTLEDMVIDPKKDVKGAANVFSGMKL
ncbi:hypothetical protein CC80DRAFT_510007 [Byssothecium circinans]|uniref:Uncharacterized protein n=1 Tax=Byssothecium circinans TaxID=147558 RepID=A0A6A5TBA3_9PLEO|nr:hypothetical protein CC80DRAFT_510007 [Byssothecium circinans]